MGWLVCDHANGTHSSCLQQGLAKALLICVLAVEVYNNGTFHTCLRSLRGPVGTLRAMGGSSPASYRWGCSEQWVAALLPATGGAAQGFVVWWL